LIAGAPAAPLAASQKPASVLALIDRAVTANPSYALGWYLGGLIRLSAGSPRARDRRHREIHPPQPA
jgi:hypothetical protein